MSELKTYCGNKWNAVASHMIAATPLLMEDVCSKDNFTVCALLFGEIPDMLHDYGVHSIWKWQADKSYLFKSSVGLIWDVINCQEDPFLS